MATELNKRLKRVTQEAVRNGGKPRRLVVTLYPGDTVGIRQQGCRKEEFISIASVYFYAIRNRVAVERMEKAKARKAKRGAR